MNPPFCKGQDIAHITHALKFLKNGGRLVAVASAGVTFRQDRRYVEFRNLIASLGGTIEMLPDGAFKSSGTDVSTCIIVVQL
jgi:16S rRNA G1207 methylase RsmC